MLRMKFNILIFLLLGTLLPAPASFGQFHDDSLTIVKNANSIISQGVKDKDSLLFSLSEGIQNPTKETDDLIQYYLGRHYFLTQDFEKSKEIIQANTRKSVNFDHKEAKFRHLDAIILATEKEYLSSIRLFLRVASAYQKEAELLKEAAVYNNIANIYLALGDHPQAYKYSRKSFDVYRHHSSDPNYLGVLGILAVCENNVNLLDSADIHINLGYAYLDTVPNILGGILLDFAKSELEFTKYNYEEAISYALKSMEKSSLYNVSQFKSMNSILLMNIYNATQEYAQALKYGMQAEELADNTNNLSMRHEITNGLSKAYAGLNNYQMAYRYKSETDSLKTKDRNERNKVQMDSLMVQFNALANENKILNQEADLALKDIALNKRKDILILLVIAILSVLVFYKFRISSMRQKEARFLAEAINESEEKERNRLSSELHDGLAGELTVLKLELEQREDSERPLEILQKAHQMTRMMAHNLSTYFIVEEGLVKAIEGLVGDYNLNNKIKFYTNIDKHLELKTKVAKILYRSVQELIQNALKHAEATEINVQVLLNGRRLIISIEDNGKGIEQEQIDKSKGIRSLFRRIELVNGKLTFNTSAGSGTIGIITINI